jgi:hypothetical protein
VKRIRLTLIPDVIRYRPRSVKPNRAGMGAPGSESCRCPSLLRRSVEALSTQNTRAAAAAASDRLRKALVDLATQGLPTHCSDRIPSHLWLSEIAGEEPRPRDCGRDVQ